MFWEENISMMMKTRQRTIQEELHLETDLIKQSADPKAELVTRQHLVTSIQLVYKSQNENWVRWPVFAKQNDVVMAARFFKIVERMDELIPIRPPVNYATYQTLKRIEFVKFQSHYSRIERTRLVARLMKIFTYHEQHKEVVA